MLQEGSGVLEGALQGLGRTPGVLRAIVMGESREALDRRPGDKSWSRTEILAHLADFEAVCFQARVETILRGDPVLALNPDKRATDIPYAAMHPFMSLDRFCKDRERSLARIRQLSPGDLASRAVHSEIGEITLANLLAEWVIHDLGHIRQLIVAAAQPYLPAIGPWRPGYKHLELSPKP
ncbi:MAG TPA: DinB family protein [Candidatus Methylomirabilis sp.]|nr:DinB family protein [Candidatus Methylomirabilis sp.]